jgi:hypothetical protein
MNSQKAAYWFCLVIFAVALRSEYQHGGFSSLHRVAGRASSTLCRVATRAEQTLAVARMLTGRPAFRADDLLAQGEVADLAQAQAEFAREQVQEQLDVVRDQMIARADMIRAQSDVRRAEIERIRWVARPEVRINRAGNHRVVVMGSGACPNSRVRITNDVEPRVAIDDEADSR